MVAGRGWSRGRAVAVLGHFGPVFKPIDDDDDLWRGNYSLLPSRGLSSFVRGANGHSGLNFPRSESEGGRQQMFGPLNMRGNPIRPLSLREATFALFACADAEFAPTPQMQILSKAIEGDKNAMVGRTAHSCPGMLVRSHGLFHSSPSRSAAEEHPANQAFFIEKALSRT